MKRVNFNKKLMSLTDKPLKDGPEDIQMNVMVANILAMSKGDSFAIRKLEIARKIYASDGAMDLEDADYDRLKIAIEKADLSTIVAGQILEAMEATS